MPRLGILALIVFGLAVGIVQASIPTPPAEIVALQGDVTAQDPAAVERGRAVFHEEIKCTSCHTLDGEGRGTAVELNTIGHRFTYLAQTEGLNATEVMEGAFSGPAPMVRVRSRMTDEQVEDLVAYLSTLLAPLTWDESFTMGEAVQGLGIFASGGCTACHTVAGIGATARGEPIPLVGIRHKQSQAVVEEKLERIRGSSPPGQSMRDRWAAIAPEDRRLILALLYYLD